MLDYAEIKLLELLADTTKRKEFGYGFEVSWLDLFCRERKDKFKNSDIFKALLNIVTCSGTIDKITHPETRSIVFFAVLQILKRLSSMRNARGGWTHFSKARFLVLFLRIIHGKDLSLLNFLDQVS